jgi:signal transduction histidine kinase
LHGLGFRPVDNPAHNHHITQRLSRLASSADLRQTGEFAPGGDESPEEELARLRARVQELEMASARGDREQLLSMLSHELRTPLQTLLLNLDLCLQRSSEPRGDPTPAWLAERLGRQRRMATRLKLLIDTFLDVGAITSGELRFDLEEVDLGALVSEVVHRAADDLSWARCPCRLDADPGVVGRWDRRQLDLAVANLLSNAIKYGAGDSIEITVRGAGRSGIVRIQDHGPGIPRLDQARIFEKFARLPTPTKVGGFGLGLWIARHLVTAAGGTITVDSEPGQGAAFTVSLPRD